MTRYATSRALALSLGVLLACDGDPSGVVPDPDECATGIAASQDGGFVELCEIAGPVRHVRITNFRAPATHASVQIVFGFDAPPGSPTEALGADQFRVLFYGGGTPGPAALAQVSFGAVEATLDGNAAFVNSGATVCFDLHDGGPGTAPAFVLWVDGQRGAQCGNRTTLTAASAYGARALWQGVTGAIDKQARLYYRQAAGSGATPTIALSSEPALDAAAIAAATSCTSAWAANTDWQPLCTPAVGIARHVRIEGAQSAANNSYFYAILGQDPDPTGSPAPSAGKLIVTAGRSNSGSSWTWYRFNTGTTTQFSYANDAAAPLYTQGPSTICFDTGSNDDGTARLVFWATGANQADCAALASLTLERALYDSTMDPSTAAIWDIPYIAGKLNFVKTSNGNVTLGNVVVSSEPAAL